jgi:hypothetical protein
MARGDTLPDLASRHYPGCQMVALSLPPQLRVLNWRSQGHGKYAFLSNDYRGYSFGDPLDYH